MSSSSSPQSTVKWGIVGLGDVTKIKSGPAFYKSDKAELVAVMSRTPGKAHAWIHEHNLEQKCIGYKSLDSMLKHPGLTAVYVATPPGAHLQVCQKIAEAKLPAYVEKPVGRCAWETQQMANFFASRDLPFYTAYISRAYERTQAVRTLLKEGAVGDKITSIKYTLRGMGGARGMQAGEQLPWRLDASISGGGLIMDVGCHLIDRIDYIFGPLVNVMGEASNRDSPNQMVEDHVELQGEIGSCEWAAIPSKGAKVECTWDFSSQESFDEILIEGPDGSLRMAAMSPSLPIQVLDSSGTVVRELTFVAPEHTAQPMIQYITNELLLSGRLQDGDLYNIVSRSDNAVRTSKVLDTVLANYYGGRDDEFWLRPETWPGRPNKNDKS